MITSRRHFLVGAAAFIASPAIIRVAGIMPVKAYAELIPVKEELLFGFADPRSLYGSAVDHPKVLWPGVKAWWGEEFDKVAAEWRDIFERDARNGS